MAQSSTIYSFDIDLSDADRGVYETLALRVARHPSESEEYLVTRVLAYCLEYTEGIQFSRGLCEPDEAAVVVRDLTGALRAWIEIGSPDAARLHQIHRADAMELYAVDRRLVASLAGALERRMAFALAVAGGEVFVSLAAATLTGEIRRLTV